MSHTNAQDELPSAERAPSRHASPNDPAPPGAAGETPETGAPRQPCAGQPRGDAGQAGGPECEPTLQQEILAMLLHHGDLYVRSGALKKYFANSRDLVRDCKAAGWLVTKVDGNRRVAYHLTDIVACLRRIRREGPPPPSKQRPASPTKPRPAKAKRRSDGTR